MAEEQRGHCVYVDVLRVIACFLVIVNHTNSDIFLGREPSVAWFLSLTWFFISKTAVPVFLMVSGAVLLPKSDTYRKTLGRAARILAAIVLFSAVYFVWQYMSGQRLFDVSQLFKGVYRDGMTNAYWYLYLYVGILLMMPILQKLEKVLKKSDYGYFFFWSLLFLGAMPILSHYVPALEYNSAFILPLFSTYIGLLLMGFFIEKKCGFERKYVHAAAALFIAMCATSVLLTFAEYRAAPRNYLFFDNRMFITITAAAVSLFYIVRYLFRRVPATGAPGKAWHLLGRCTFGIYLLSDMGIELLRPLYGAMAAVISPLPAMLAYELAVFACGFAVTLLLTRIPILNKII